MINARRSGSSSSAVRRGHISSHLGSTCVAGGRPNEHAAEPQEETLLHHHIVGDGHRGIAAAGPPERPDGLQLVGERKRKAAARLELV